MPNYISKDGIWYPAKERVALKNLGAKTMKNPSVEGSKFAGERVKPKDDYIYEGPDRAALFELYQQGTETFGEDFKRNTEFLQQVRNMGFNTVDEFLAHVGYDKNKVETTFKEKASVVVKHETPERVEALHIMGGGKDTTGGGLDREGGFGPAPAV